MSVQVQQETQRPRLGNALNGIKSLDGVPRLHSLHRPEAVKNMSTVTTANIDDTNALGDANPVATLAGFEALSAMNAMNVLGGIKAINALTGQTKPNTTANTPRKELDSLDIQVDHVEDNSVSEVGDVNNAYTHAQANAPPKIFLGSIDQGTTSSRFLIFGTDGEPVASHQIEFENQYPHSGWHEHKPMELLESVQECITGAMDKFAELGYSKDDIRAVGITNQRETTLVWDKHTGEPLYNAVVWPDTRTGDIVRELRGRKNADSLKELCGLPLSTYPSSVKLMWLLENVEAVKQAYEEGRLAFGTVDTWLIYKLNGGASASPPVHVTDTTNASRTMFMNLRTRQYDDTLLSFFGIDKTKIALPQIVSSSEPEAFGKIADGALEGVRITGCLGDQSAALVGQCGFSPGQAKNTYGTGCFLLYNVGTEPVISKSGLLATVAYDFGRSEKPVYALEGSIAVAGSGVKFLTNNLGFATSSSEITDLAATVKDNGGVVFVTAFSGLFAPYWIDDAKGTVFGITSHTTKAHIARATLEATCFQTKAILDAMANDSGRKLESLAVDGGLSNSDLTMQTQADLTGIRVDRPRMRETTALGAAIAAGLATDVWREVGDIKEVNQVGRTIFEPKLERKKADKMFRKWEQAVEMSRGWVRHEHDDE